MDNQTSEYFYWQEESNLYNWNKPPLFKKQPRDFIELLEVGSDIMYKFPGRRLDEVATILKQRFDDETGFLLHFSRFFLKNKIN